MIKVWWAGAYAGSALIGVDTFLLWRVRTGLGDAGANPASRHDVIDRQRDRRRRGHRQRLGNYLQV
ncbi:MAG: hypothetical protein WBV39_06770, partial [Rudaea sp.]